MFHFPYYTDETLGFFDHLIHQEALQEDADEIVSCRISSFRNWLMESRQLTSKTYTLRFGADIYREGEFSSLIDAREWAVKPLGDLKEDCAVSLWQGAMIVEFLQ